MSEGRPGGAPGRMDIRMIASDVDGTMLPRGGAITPALRRAIGGCRARGIPFVIATGRWIGALTHIIDAAGCGDMPLVIANGAAVIGADGAPMREWLIDEAQAREVYRILRRFDVQVNSYLRDALYCVNSAALMRQSTMIREYIGGHGCKLVVDDEARLEAEALRGCYKLEAMTEDRALIAAVEAALAGSDLAVTHSSPRNVEIMAPDAGKGRALAWLAARLGCTLAQCMAFGDSANDLDMLRAVGWPVAMGNADDAVMAACRLVAPKDTEDGVARALERYVLN